MRLTLKHRAITGLALFLFALAALPVLNARPTSQDRAQIPDQYKWDLSQIYTNWAEWEQGLARLESMRAEYAGLKGTLSNGPKALLKATRLGDELGILEYKVYRYPALTSAQDTRDNAVAAKLQQVEISSANFAVAAAWYNPELLSIPWETMKTWLDSTPELAPYRHSIGNLYRQQAHVLSKDKEQLLAYFSQAAEAPSRIFKELSLSDIKYPTLTLSSGETVRLTPGNYQNLISNNRVQADRAKAFSTFNEIYFKNKNTYASIYNGILQNDWASAQARRYNSCLEAVLDRDNVPTTVYETLVKTVKAGVAPVQRYHALAKKRLGLKEYHLYDGLQPLVKFDKTYPYDEIQPWIIEAMAPLGKDYQDRLRRAFTNRWIDVYENEGKTTGGYMANTYGVHPYILMNYNETLSEMFTVAHELGHAMHSMLSNENQAFVNAEPLTFIAEVASTMNEALLLDYLLKKNTDPAERIALLTYAIRDIEQTFYTQSMWAEFEWSIHRSVEKNQPVTAQSVRDIYTAIQDSYLGREITVDDYYRYSWTRISHFYHSPFYVYKYATCFATSSKLAEAIMSEDKTTREEGLKRYMTLLKAGNSDYPMTLLQNAGVNLNEPSTYQAIIDRTTRYVTLLEQELAKLK